VAGSGNEKGNVTIVDTANVGDTQVSIRGIVSTRDAEWTFACVVDGVLITNPNAFNGELIDIAQIEVLKGRMELALALRYDEEDRSVSNQVPNVLSSGLNINLAGQPINPAYTQFPGGIPDCHPPLGAALLWSGRHLPVLADPVVQPLFSTFGPRATAIAPLRTTARISAHLPTRSMNSSMRSLAPVSSSV
jgi:hypothetical protein